MNLRHLSGLLLLVAVTYLDASAQESGRPSPLKGIEKVSVVAGYSWSPPSLAPQGLTQLGLQGIVELRLRNAGLQVLTEEAALKAQESIPYIFATVWVSPSIKQRGSNVLFVYQLSVSARLPTKVPLNGAYAPVELWAASSANTTEGVSATGDIQERLGDLLTDLIEAWKKANPNR